MARVLIAAIVAMVIAILVGPRFIAYLRKNEFGQHIREEGPERHAAKQGTPTMGGLLIVAAASIAFLALSRFTPLTAPAMIRKRSTYQPGPSGIHESTTGMYTSCRSC